MKSAFNILSAVLVMMSAVSCLVENDMAYPRIIASITAFEVEGQVSVSIDENSRRVEVVLSETADVSNLKVTKFEYTEAATCEDLRAGDIINLSSAKRILLRTYQDYEWTISAIVPVERYLHCRNQLGEAEIDLADRTVSVSVSDVEDVGAVVIDELKLESDGAVLLGYEENGEIIPIVSFPLTLDCSTPRVFVLEYGGEQVRWELTVTPVSIAPEITSVNPWSKKAGIAAVFSGEGSPYFQYKHSSDNAWTDYRDVETDGVYVSAEISGLAPDSEYELRIVSDGEESESMTFMTEATVQLPNMSFDSWYNSGTEDHPLYFPNESKDVFIWDSANKASTTFNLSCPTTPEPEDVAVPGAGKNAARLESKKALMLLAAGNIYTGEFVTTQGIGAILNWGVPFASRPTSLKGWFKYHPVAIDMSDEAHKDLKGKIDTCQVQILLTDWSEPFEINTSANKFVDFDNDPGIIAYGKMESGENMSEYEEFTIDLEYRDTVRKPKYIVITACSSKYGDYFTGGVGSTLLVDEFELIYE